DLLDGFQTSVEPSGNTIPVRDGSSFLHSSWINLEIGTGLFTEAGNYFNEEGSGWRIRSNSNSIVTESFKTLDEVTRGTIYGDNSNSFGFLDSAGNWAVRATTGTSLELRVSNSVIGSFTIDGLVLSGRINTGQGLTEVYLMNQNLQTVNSPTFNVLNATSVSTVSHLNSGAWLTGYNQSLVSASFNSGNGNITLGRQSAPPIVFNLDGRYLTSATNNFVSSASFNTGDGVLTLVRSGLGDVTVDLDGRYETAFSKLTAFNKNFGTTVGTVAEGNDSRILNGRTAFGWGNFATQIGVTIQAYSASTTIQGVITLASLGYTGASNANFITNNNELTNGAGYITSPDGGDAATLDGIDSLQFARTDQSETFTKNVFFNKAIQTGVPTGQTNPAQKMRFGEVVDTTGQAIEPTKYLSVQFNDVLLKVAILQGVTKIPLGFHLTNGTTALLNYSSSPTDHYIDSFPIEVGDVIYSDSLTLLPVVAGFYGYDFWYYEANSSGEVISKTFVA
ncbi:MAG: hypothetical protein JKX82_04965, partial [Oleispira sp.]|nr:hypothetical protein [Oleispira sp.]